MHFHLRYRRACRSSWKWDDLPLYHCPVSHYTSARYSWSLWWVLLDPWRALSYAQVCQRHELETGQSIVLVYLKALRFLWGVLTGPVHDCDEPSLLLSMKRLFSLLACYSKGEQLCHEMQLIVAVAIALFIIKQLYSFPCPRNWSMPVAFLSRETFLSSVDWPSLSSIEQHCRPQ